MIQIFFAGCLLTVHGAQNYMDKSSTAAASVEIVFVMAV